MWVSALRGGGSLFEGFKPVFSQHLEKTTENSKRLGRLTRPRIEPGISRLPVMSAELLRHWRGINHEESVSRNVFLK